MKLVNVWIAIPVDKLNEMKAVKRENPEFPLDPRPHPQIDKFGQRMLDHSIDNQFKEVQQGQTVRRMTSVILRESEGKINQQVNEYRTAVPGSQVMGAWTPDGEQYLDPDTGEIAFEISDQLINYMPNGVLEDVNLPMGWEPRIFA